MSASLYHEHIMWHYRHSPYRYTQGVYDVCGRGSNPSCGDAIEIQAVIAQDICTKVSFSGKGCVLSQAAASLLAEYAHNKKIEELLFLSPQTLLSWIKLDIGPTRARCVLLSLDALTDGIKEYARSGKTSS
jgi:nitrogen fixation protein NifU and related proteins